MRCPRCSAPDLDPSHHDESGMVTCSCGHRVYAGYLAEADALTARVGWLTDRIAAGDPAPAPGIARAYGIWAAPDPTQPTSGYAPGQPARAPASGGPPSAQTVLLGLGALLLVVAGAVFAAVTWDRLGTWGQVAFMVLATAGVAALAIRLRRRLPGTAEALAVVAAGLAAVDLVAAPALGLLPPDWIEDPTLYPALAFGGLGIALLLCHQRTELRAWLWLGWLSVLSAALLVIPATAAAFDSGAWTAASITVPALTSVAMLAAAQHPRRWESQVNALRANGGLGLIISAMATAAAAMSPDTRPGALVTAAATALAVGIWAALDRTGGWLLPHGAAALAGVTVALMLGLPADPQPVWLAAAVALAGLTVGMVLWVVQGDEPRWSIPVVGAAAVWSGWALLRVVAPYEVRWESDLVESQLALLGVLVAAVAFAVAWWLPAAGWVGALLAAGALSIAPGLSFDAVEWYSLPWAVLLLVAGLLWRRRGPTPSLVWLGPAVAMALLPSAVAAWGAPWAVDIGGLGTSGHLMRLGGLLFAGVLAVVVGARTRLGGLLLPAALALIITAGAQVWGGLATLPRFLGLALAGTLLVVAGARIEWLRREGRRMRSWVAGLR